MLETKIYDHDICHFLIVINDQYAPLDFEYINLLTFNPVAASITIEDKIGHETPTRNKIK